MKTIIMMSGMLLLCRLFCFSQIEVTRDKTTMLVFESTIKTTDRGTASLLVQKNDAHVLLLKARDSTMPETNLTVITDDDSIRQFIVRYVNVPSQYLYHIGTPEKKDAVAAIAKALIGKAEAKFHRRATDGDISIELQNIFLSADHFFLQVVLRNRSRIPYDVRHISIFRADKKQVKRTSMQEEEVDVVQQSGNLQRIEPMSAQTAVIVIQKCTLEKGKVLRLRMQEQNGARDPILTIKNRQMENCETFKQ